MHVLCAIGGHNVVMEIQATIPSKPTAAKPNPTCAPMMVRVTAHTSCLFPCLDPVPACGMGAPAKPLAQLYYITTTSCH